MNKYANQYLDTLKEKLLAYKPFNQGDANTTGAATGAALGAAAGGGIGALSGLVSDPGYDEQGQRKSRIKASLKGLIGGGAIGAGAGALGAVALPTLGQGAVDLDTQIRKRILNPYRGDTSGGTAISRFVGRANSNLFNFLTNVSGENDKHLLASRSVQDYLDRLSGKPLPVEPSVLQKIQNLFKGVKGTLGFKGPLVTGSPYRPPNPADLSPANRDLSPLLKKHFNNGVLENTQPFY